MVFTKINFESQRVKITFAFLLSLLIIVGILMRFYRITENTFFYYDEGMWLNANRSFIDAVGSNPPKTFTGFINILNILSRLSLITGKALWAFIAGLRVFFTGADGWYFVRVVSAVFGVLTLFVQYFLSKRILKSSLAALFAVALLAIFPSHVYYSRVGLQEAFSTFCFLLGIYLYLVDNRVHFRTFLSAVLFSFVYFSNYRMIIIPLLIIFAEFFIWVTQKQKPCYKKIVWTIVIFLILVFTIGSIKVGKYTNSYVTFSWMFHQGQMANGHFDFINLFSYPYYLFCLESIFFGAAFFGNLYFIVKKQYDKLLPFALVCFLMIPFSFSQEKGVRYLCAVMPFMVISVSAIIIELFKAHKDNIIRIGLIFFVVIMVITQIGKDNSIVQFNSDYQISIDDLLAGNKSIKILSSQSMIQKLFVKNEKDVVELKSDLGFLVKYYANGFRYVVIDPQAYVYLASDDKRFNPKLSGALEFIKTSVPPIKKYPHFNQALLERFVLEHNENLMRSISFLNANKNGSLSSLYVYDLGKSLIFIKQFIERKGTI